MITKPPAVPKDGATFHGSISVMPNGEWRANCYWCIGAELKAEDVQSRSFDTEGDARLGAVSRRGARVQVDGVGLGGRPGWPPERHHEPASRIRVQIS